MTPKKVEPSPRVGALRQGSFPVEPQVKIATPEADAHFAHWANACRMAVF